MRVASEAWTGRPCAPAREGPDEWGLTEEDWDGIIADQRAEDRRQAWKAIRALWGPPIRERPRDSRKGWTVYDGYRRNRDEEWTLWAALVATVAIILRRHWGQTQEERWRERTGWYCTDSRDLAFWDSASTYSGYESQRLQLYPGGYVSIFSDGECLM